MVIENLNVFDLVDISVEEDELNIFITNYIEFPRDTLLTSEEILRDIAESTQASFYFDEEEDLPDEIVEFESLMT